MSARGEAPAPHVDPVELLAPGEDVFLWVSREGDAIFARAPVVADFVEERRAHRPERTKLYLGCSAFDDTASGEEFAPYAHVAYHDAAAIRPPDAALPPLRGALDSDDARAAWHALVERALTAIDGGAATKIVCARIVRLTATAAIDAQLLARTMMHAEGTYRYLVRSDGVIFAGASPERLVEKRADVMRTEAVAGTAPLEHDDTPLEEREKDKREHLAVVLAIEETLAPLTLALEHAEQPLVRRVGRVQHLVTPFEGRVDPATHVLDLADALHPTPAVAGTPRDVALDFIAQHEDIDRGLYAGPVGWFDSNGDGELAVALRCVRIEGNVVELYAGAGIVGGSDPDAEFDETVLKMRSTLASLGFELQP